jgi:aspartate aminotransferase
MMDRSSWIRKMFETGALLKAQHGADRVCDFSLGNPNLDPPEQFQEALLEILGEKSPGRHRYMQNAGYPEVRQRVSEAVSGEQGVALSKEQLIMTCGAGGAMNVALKAILNPGDRIIVSTPCFMEYAFYADNHGGALDLVPSRDDFDLDIDALEAKITPSTAGLIVNSPNNPTGRIYPQGTLRDLGQMLEEKSRKMGRGIYLISDEPYRKIVYDGMEVPSAMAAYANSIVAGSYSKDLSIPGERIGFLAVHPEAEDLQALMNAFILCNRILGFVNAPALMQRAVARLQGISVDPALYQTKRDRLWDGLVSAGYQVVRPDGTFYLFPESPNGDDLAIVEALRQELILTVPGRGFGTPGYFRIAFCVDDAVIERSLEGFARARERVLAPQTD